jgi:HTH-type transcriptional regulator / antitoxin HipB
MDHLLDPTVLEPGSPDLGLTLRMTRLRYGLKQYEVANRAGLRQPELSQIENGHVTPTADKLHRIARAISGAGNP